MRCNLCMCRYCGASRDLTIDHVIPQSKGGQNTWNNLVTACMKCNQRKGHATLQQVGRGMVDSMRITNVFLYAAAAMHPLLACKTVTATQTELHKHQAAQPLYLLLKWLLRVHLVYYTPFMLTSPCSCHLPCLQIGWRLRIQPREPTPYEVGIILGISSNDVEKPPPQWALYLQPYKDKLDKVRQRRAAAVAAAGGLPGSSAVYAAGGAAA